jgi:hypothetical protein
LGVWRDAIRLLEPAEVIIPYAQLIEVPSHRVRVRRDVNRLLDVIRVHAWLHQHGRERDEQDRVLATEVDFHKAVELVADSLERSWKSLTPAEEAVLRAIGSLSEAKRKNGFTRSDLQVEGTTHGGSRTVSKLSAKLATSSAIGDLGRRGIGTLCRATPRIRAWASPYACQTAARMTLKGPMSICQRVLRPLVQPTRTKGTNRAVTCKRRIAR